MVNTERPLQEKIALFWHGLFATGYAKLNQARSLLNQIDMFRRHGLGPLPQLLIEISKDPAMIIWLDNNENHNGAINENYGRELLELFSMGIGHYTEEDIKECSRAFTGWTLGNAEYMAVRAHKDSIWPYGRIAWHFEYRPGDHDDGEKTFLNRTGRFNGEDIIDIIAENEATAHFITTRLFQFFGADEIDDEGRAVINNMIASYFDSSYEIRSVLRTLFLSEYFKSEHARFTRVKGPVELVVGGIRMAGSYNKPTLGIEQVSQQAFYMGQGLFQPPSVEGWHEGTEWINSGALVERVNFVARELAEIENPGCQQIIKRLSNYHDGVLIPMDLVNICLDLLGPVQISETARTALIEHAARNGNLDLRNTEPGDKSEQRVGEILRLIASSREYQLA